MRRTGYHAGDGIGLYDKDILRVIDTALVHPDRLFGIPFVALKKKIFRNIELQVPGGITDAGDMAHLRGHLIEHVPYTIIDPILLQMISFEIRKFLAVS